MECAKEVGFTNIRDGQLVYDDSAAWYSVTLAGILNGDPTEVPTYSTSYDAIMPEIQKLAGENTFLDELMAEEIGAWTVLNAKPWQLALAWLHVKQQKV